MPYSAKEKLKKWFVVQLDALNCGGSWYPTPLTGCEELAGSDLQDREGPSKTFEKLTALIVIMPTHYSMY